MNGPVDRSAQELSLRNAAVVALGIGLMAGIHSSSAAQDRVIVQSLNSGSGKLGIAGSIEEFSGERIVVREPDGKQVRVLLPDQYRLLEVETRHSPEYDAGLQAYQAGKFDEARKQWEQAVSKEDRRWMRREILAWLVRCALAQEDLASAGNRCLKILESDPRSPHLALLPLKWWPGEEVSSPLLTQAAAWMNEESEPARLLGASYLLEEGRRSADAKAVLNELSRSTDVRIRSWATIQLWRIPLQEKTPGEPQLQLWQQQWKELPTDLRSGPALLLGHALSEKMPDHHDQYQRRTHVPLLPDRLYADRGSG